MGSLNILRDCTRATRQYDPTDEVSFYSLTEDVRKRPTIRSSWMTMILVLSRLWSTLYIALTMIAAVTSSAAFLLWSSMSGYIRSWTNICTPAQAKGQREVWTDRKNLLGNRWFPRCYCWGISMYSERWSRSPRATGANFTGPCRWTDEEWKVLFCSRGNCRLCCRSRHSSVWRKRVDERSPQILLFSMF